VRVNTLFQKVDEILPIADTGIPDGTAAGTNDTG
jgi:hypothetical protein